MLMHGHSIYCTYTYSLILLVKFHLNAGKYNIFTHYDYLPINNPPTLTHGLFLFGNYDTTNCIQLECY